MLRPGDLACPAPVRTFTTELSWAESPQIPTSVMTVWLLVIYHRQTFTGWTVGLMGCERISRIRSGHYRRRMEVERMTSKKRTCWKPPMDTKRHESGLKEPSAWLS